MTTLREAAERALEALEQLHGGCTDSDDGTVEAITVWCPEVIEALRAALAEPVQEAGCHVFNVTVTGKLHEWEPTTFAFALRDGKHALYTAPPQRKPLTEEEIKALIDSVDGLGIGRHVMHKVARAIERAHGIGGGNE